MLHDHTTRLPGVRAYVVYNSPKDPRILYRTEEGSTVGHGDSGGPMLNDKGEIVGVIATGGGHVTSRYGIPSLGQDGNEVGDVKITWLREWIDETIHNNGGDGSDLPEASVVDDIQAVGDAWKNVALSSP